MTVMSLMMIAPIPVTDTTKGGGTEPPGLGSSGICVSYLTPVRVTHLTPVRVTHLTRERARVRGDLTTCVHRPMMVYT
jgi:hypothetical protein